ncbi:MAG: hypothetical protein JWO51_2998 [Rhodospirillales bacterium]|jgi:uncharacterized cupredoxin-like copper-binding protein|nr:hypothetical protein [Rhodospirillales bacterium]
MDRRLASLACLALAACASPAPPGPSPAARAAPEVDWEKARPVTVRLTDFAFTPDHLSFVAGVPVRLILINAGSGTHDFSAPRFFAAAAYRQETAAAADGDVTLKAGQTTELDLVPGQAGTYPLECTEFLHATFGMTGMIAVTDR